MLQLLIEFSAFCLFVLVAVLVLLLWKQIDRQRQNLKPGARQQAPKKVAKSPSPSPAKLEHSPRLYQQLLSLLHGDVDGLHRLCEAEARRHPQKDKQWILEKVIYDLERDRSR